MSADERQVNRRTDAHAAVCAGGKNCGLSILEATIEDCFAEAICRQTREGLD
jgi:hypothetical protein